MREVWNVAIGGLLHDIGKFMQRAGVELDAQTMRMQDIICPFRNGKHTHWHVLHTNAFFHNYFPAQWLGSDEDNACNLASFHHNPSSDLQKLVQRADRVSSGIDRDHLDDEEEDQGKYAFRKRRMRPVLETIELKHELREGGGKYRYELEPLALNRETVFPKMLEQLQPREGDDLRVKYNRLWQEFLRELDNLAQDDPELFLQQLYYLLHKYTWCIPSTTMESTDVSLFDHLRSTAAIACCLYQRMLDSSQDKDDYLLLIGDLSGIQQFIYRVAQQSTSGVAKRIRGRSFYLSVLAEVISRYLLDCCGLPLVNRLYCGGGRFELLLANTPATKKAVGEAARRIEDWLLAQYQGELGLVLASVTAGDTDMKDFGRLLLRADEKLAEAKQHKFLSRIRDGSRFFLEASSHTASVCPSCHLTPVKEEDSLCPDCIQHQEIGAFLPRVRYIAFEPAGQGSQGPAGSGGLTVEFGPFGRVHLLSGEPRTPSALAVNEVEGTGFTFLGNAVPVAQDTIKDPEAEDGFFQPGQVVDFTAVANLSTGDKRIGVLKMDVDHLGLIFSLGLEYRGKSEARSLSRIATLSRQMDLFFAGYLNIICREQTESWRSTSSHPDKDKISSIFYISYAGGDDLLVFGPASEIPHLAKRISDEFKEYCCRNPNLSISAGIFLCKPKFPASRAAQLAGEELDAKAKDANSRSSIAIFGEAVHWSDSGTGAGFDQLIAAGETLYQAVRDRALPRGFLHQVLRIHRQHLKQGRTNLNYIPALIYQISRNIDPNATLNNGQPLRQYLHEILISRGFEFFKKITIPVTYAMLKSRKE